MASVAESKTMMYKLKDEGFHRPPLPDADVAEYKTMMYELKEKG